MQRKLSRRTAGPTAGPLIEEVRVVDLSVVALSVVVDGLTPPAGHYLGLTVEDVGVQHDGRRLTRFRGSVRGITTALRFMGRAQEAECVLIHYGLPALAVHRKLQA